MRNYLKWRKSFTKQEWFFFSIFVLNCSWTRIKLCSWSWKSPNLILKTCLTIKSNKKYQNFMSYSSSCWNNWCSFNFLMHSSYYLRKISFLKLKNNIGAEKIILLSIKNTIVRNSQYPIYLISDSYKPYTTAPFTFNLVWLGCRF